MKKSNSLPPIMFIFFFAHGFDNLYAQNTDVRLHIVSPSSNTAIFDGNSAMYIKFLENGVYRGYMGSYSGSASSVDFGTGVGNTTGSVHLTLAAVPKFTLNQDGNIGIGTVNPSQKLELFDGNIKLHNTTLGIILNNADRPLITRGFDAFSSGSYAGIGRWGMFMEPHKLVLGIPNLSGKGVEIARYNANSTRETLLTVHDDGQMTRPATGGADLLPICMGSIRWNNGTLTNTPIINGTGNFTLTPYSEQGFVEITINGEYYTTSNFITQVTCIRDDNYGSATGRAVVRDSGNGKLQVYTYINGNTQYSRSFHFVVYKL